MTRRGVALAVWLAGSGCGGDSDPTSPSPPPTSALAGAYVFVSVTDKASNTTVVAGQTVDFDGPGILPEGAIAGELALGTTSCTFTWTTTPAGLPAVPATASGSYVVSGSTITFTIVSSTITSAIPVGSDTLTYSLSGGRLTLDDEDKRFVYDRQ